MQLRMTWIVCLIVLTTQVFAASGAVQGQNTGAAKKSNATKPPRSAKEERVLKMKRLEEGVAKPDAKVRKVTTRQGHLKFMSIHPTDRVDDPQNQNVDPRQIADRFIQQGKGLWSEDNARFGFKRVKTSQFMGHRFIQYQQTYGGLDVFRGWVVIDVDDKGRTALANCRGMRESGLLGRRTDLKRTEIRPAQAKDMAIAWMLTRHSGINLEATQPKLMIFDPVAIGSDGEPQVVWHTEVKGSDSLIMPMGVLLAADSGQIVHHYALGAWTFSREIWDGKGTDDRGDDGPSIIAPNTDISNDSTDPVEMDCIAVARFLEDSKEFYATVVCDSSNPTDDDDFDKPFEVIINDPLYGGYVGLTTGGATITMQLKISELADGLFTLCDDLVGHEFSHAALDWFGQDDSEAGAIREGVCDVFGEWIDQFNGDCYGHAYDLSTGTFSTSHSRSFVVGHEYGANWDMFEDRSATEYSVGTFKDPELINKPAIYRGNHWDIGTDVSAYTGYSYTNLGVVRKLAYLLDNGATFHGIEIDGLGTENAAKLFWYVKNHWPGVPSKFYDLADDLIASAGSMEGSYQGLIWTTDDTMTVKQACIAVGIWPNDDGIIYVDASTTTPGSGASLAFPRKTLQEAMDVITVNEDYYTEIRLAGGTYTLDETAILPVDFTLARDESSTGETIIQINATKAGLTVLRPGAGCTIKNVTIEGQPNSAGWGIDVRGNLTMEGCTIKNFGTGIDVRVSGASLHITGGTIKDNSVRGVFATECDITIDGGCSIENNGTVEPGNNTDSGGGINAANGTLTIENVTFNNNRVASGGGGAIYRDGGTTLLKGCTFRNNKTVASGAMMDHSYGGAIRAINSSTSTSTVKIYRCIFEGNRAGMDKVPWTINTETAQGGAIFSDSELTVVSSVFTGNISDTYGGAISNNSGSCDLYNCTFIDNYSHLDSTSTHTLDLGTWSQTLNQWIDGGNVYNCIFWYNPTTISNFDETRVCFGVSLDDRSKIHLLEQGEPSSLTGSNLIMYRHFLKAGALGFEDNSGTTISFIDQGTGPSVLTDYPTEDGERYDIAGGSRLVPAPNLGGYPDDAPDSDYIDIGAHEFGSGTYVAASAEYKWDLGLLSITVYFSGASNAQDKIRLHDADGVSQGSQNVGTLDDNTTAKTAGMVTFSFSSGMGSGEYTARLIDHQEAELARCSFRVSTEGAINFGLVSLSNYTTLTLETEFVEVVGTTEVSFPEADANDNAFDASLLVGGYASPSIVREAYGQFKVENLEQGKLYAYQAEAWLKDAPFVYAVSDPVKVLTRPSLEVLQTNETEVIVGMVLAPVSADGYDMADDLNIVYYFVNTSTGKTSGWQSQYYWQDANDGAGLIASTGYPYTVQFGSDPNSVTGIPKFVSAESVAVTATTLTPGAADTQPPYPDPMKWSVEPFAATPGAVSMTAYTAVDLSPPVQYRIQRQQAGEPNVVIGIWQTEPNFYVDGLDVNTPYSFQVQAMDDANNVTAWSEAVTVYADNAAPTLNATPWASMDPYYTHIIMTAGAAQDDSNTVEYEFFCVSNSGGGSNSGWITSTEWTDTYLEEAAYYSYKYRTRDGVPNESAWSSVMGVTTQIDYRVPEPNPMQWDPNDVLYVGATQATIQAVDVNRPCTGNQYYFACSDPNFDSGWQDDRVYTARGLSPNTLYNFQVKARRNDKPVLENTYSAILPVTTQVSSGPVHNVTSDARYGTIAQALDEALDGDVLVLDTGTYYESVIFTKSADVTLRSTDPNNWTVVESTILDASNASPAGSAVIFGPYTNSHLEGVTIQGSDFTQGYGAGIFSSSLSYDSYVTNCLIRNNIGLYGGGLYGGATVKGSRFENNQAVWAGGAVYLQDGSITNCTFTDNSITEPSAHGGGALWCDPGLSVTGCTFTSNNSPTVGGAVRITGTDLVNCMFVDNNSVSHGGAVYAQGLDNVVGSVFRGNASQTYGGGLYSYDTDNLTVLNCTFILNNSTLRGGGIYAYGPYCDIKNSLFWLNGSEATRYNHFTSSTLGNPHGDFDLWACCLSGTSSDGTYIRDTGSDYAIGYDEGGQFVFADPVFLDNWHLSATSPCVDKGMTNSLLPATDIDGDTRVLGASPDIGADEVALTGSGLIGYWPLNETSGTLAEDLSGSDLDGTLTHGPTFVPGVINNGVSFDGIDDHVTMGSVAMGLDSHVTVALWLNFSGANANNDYYQTVFGKGDYVHPFRIQKSGNKVRAACRTSAQTAGLISTTSPALGTWYHVAGTYGDGTFALYLNGQLEAQMSLTGSLTDTAQLLTMGRAPSGGGAFYGLVDDVRVYNRSLSSTEVASLANSMPWTDTTPPTPNPMAFSSSPTATGSSSIAMTAATASDISGPVEYYFECLTAGGHDSGWQSSTPYEDTGLSASTSYTYRVKARDAAGNETNPSVGASDSTDSGYLGAVHNLTTNAWHATVQAGIDAAFSGHVLEVSPGTHYGTVDFLGKQITLRSQDPNDWAVVAATVIHSNGAQCVATVDSSGLFEGLTVTGASSLDDLYGGVFAAYYATIRNCIIENNKARYAGGILGGNNTTIINCKIRNNEAKYWGGGAMGSSATYIDCEFTNNVSGDYGGGLSGEANVVTDCNFSGNTAAQEGGGIYSTGGNVITGTTISNNTAGTQGGGIYLFWYASNISTVENCTLSGNQAIDGGGIYGSECTVINSVIQNNSATGLGGGLYTLANFDLWGNVFIGNSSQSHGGGLYVTDGNPSVNYCSFIGNSAVQKGGAIYTYNRVIYPKSTLFTGNTGSEAKYNHFGSTWPSYSSIQPYGCAIDDAYKDGSNYIRDNASNSAIARHQSGNFVSGDLMLTNQWHLVSGSPCINMGYGVSGGPSTDIDGDPRSNGTIDIGADEY